MKILPAALCGLAPGEWPAVAIGITAMVVFGASMPFARPLMPPARRHPSPHLAAVGAAVAGPYLRNPRQQGARR